MELAGRRFVVTGAASGIGDALSRLLLAQGAEVVSLDRNEPAAPVHDHRPCDLSDPEQIAAVVDGLDGSWYGLCNVAGVPGTAPPSTVVSVNFLGLRLLTELLLPRIEQGGAVVNVASTAGTFWQARTKQLGSWLATRSFAEGLAWYEANASELKEVPVYDLTKEAVLAYTFAACGKVWGKHGVRMNAVSPGPVETPILADFEATMPVENLDLARKVGGRWAVPDDIAPIVAFAVSPAAGWLIGNNLTADGGLSGTVLGWALRG